MGSPSHPHASLVRRSIQGTIENTIRNGGVVPATIEARRLATTYPDSGMSEAEILAEFGRLAELNGLLLDLRSPAATLPAMQRNDGPPAP